MRTEAGTGKGGELINKLSDKMTCKGEIRV